jgi:hypothetical protein
LQFHSDCLLVHEAACDDKQEPRDAGDSHMRRAALSREGAFRGSKPSLTVGLRPRLTP